MESTNNELDGRKEVFMLEWKRLGEVCEVLDSQRKPVSKGKRTKGAYPYYGANGIQDYVDDYLFDGTYLLMGEDGSVINKDKSPVLHWAEGKIWVNNHAHILKESEPALLRYLYYMLQCIDVTDIVRGVPPKINQANMRNILIPIPSIAEQTRIVGILDTFTAAIDNLKQQIAQRRKQYEYYRDQLLDLEGKEGVEMKILSEVAELGTGSSNTNEELSMGKYPFFVRSQAVRYKDEYEFDETAIITSGDGVGVGKIFHYIEGKYALHQRAYRIHLVKDAIVPKFFYYYFACHFYDYIQKNAFNSSVTSVRKPMLQKFPTPIIDKEKQMSIVSKLETFEQSIANLEQQLAQRERQYEYYRERLLECFY